MYFLIYAFAFYVYNYILQVKKIFNSFNFDLYFYFEVF